MQYHTVQLIVDDINIVQLQSCIFYFSIFFFYFFFNFAVYMNLYSSKKLAEIILTDAHIHKINTTKAAAKRKKRINDQ